MGGQRDATSFAAAPPSAGHDESGCRYLVPFGSRWPDRQQRPRADFRLL